MAKNDVKKATNVMTWILIGLLSITVCFGVISGISGLSGGSSDNQQTEQTSSEVSPF
jgi:hypothetical protein